MDLAIQDPAGGTGLPFISGGLTRTHGNAPPPFLLSPPPGRAGVPRLHPEAEETKQLHVICNSFLTLLPLLLQKCLRFNPDATVWKAKQQVLCSLTESLRDVLNYGLFQPATDGHDAKFLEEERLLKEYPQSFEKGVPYLEVN